MSKPLSIWVLFAALPCISACQSPLGPLNETDVFILPKGYVGRVVIFYEQPKGEPEKIVDGERIFAVPEGGIVLTQAPPSYEWAEFPRYYYDSINPNTRIQTRVDWSQYRSDSVNASLISLGSFGLEENPVRINFGQFFIGTREQIDSVANQAEHRRIQSLFPPE